MRKSDLLAAVPIVGVLAVDPAGLSPFGPVKWALVPTLVLAGLAVAGPPRTAVRPGVAWLAFLGAAVVAAALAVDPLYAWTGTPERHFGVVAWLVCAAAFVGGQALDDRGRRRLFGAGAVTAGLLGAWATAEAFGWQPFDVIGAGERPLGTLGSSAFVGAAAVLLGPLAFTARRHRWTAIPALVALVASGARAAWLGAVVALALVAVLRRTVPLRVVSGAVAVAIVVALATGTAGRLVDLGPDGGVRGRLDEWRVAARVVAGRPLTGVGPEGYRIAFGRHVDDDYERAHGRHPLPDRAHSAVLDVAATTGLLGLGAYLALFALVGRRLVAAVRHGPPAQAAAATGIVAYGVQSLFLFPVAALDPVAWLLAGAVIIGTDAPVRVPVARAVPAAAAVFAVLTFGAGLLDVAADRRAHHHPTASPALRPDAVRYRLVAARAYEDDGALDRALVELDHAARVSRRDPVVRAERARLLLAHARRTGLPVDLQAARGALEALAVDDPRNAEGLLRLGVARALDGDHAGAEQAWLRAEYLAPTSAAASTDLAIAYARAGRWDEARAAAARALAREPGNERARRILDSADGT